MNLPMRAAARTAHTNRELERQPGCTLPRTGWWGEHVHFFPYRQSRAPRVSRRAYRKASPAVLSCYRTVYV